REDALARTYSFNTAGALLGSLLTGFVLLPRFGPEGALYPLLAAAWLGGLWLRCAKPIWVVSSLLAFLGLGFWMHEGSASRPELFLASDAHATVSVEENSEDSSAPIRSLRVNGKVVATSAPVDLRLQRLLGHIPGLLHGEVKRALVIGLGTGMTAGSLLDLEPLEQLDIFEISARVPEAAAHFSPWNGNVMTDPRTHVQHADGRHALATSEATWDLITSDPIHPWTRGSSDLYSVEHFENMAAHLAPGGVASQWLPLYQLSTLDVQTVIASWCEAFPHTSAWLTAYDLALVGSSEPLSGDISSSQVLFRGDMRQHMQEAGIHSAAELFALEVAETEDLRRFVGDVQPMRDDRPVLEFRAPFSYLGGYASEVLAWSGRDDYIEQLPLVSQGRAREVRVLLRDFLDALPAGLSQAAHSYGQALLALPAQAE
ncbi:MAG: spermidine synthase, partial [Candidatus Paceibacteria bacterium]